VVFTNNTARAPGFADRLFRRHGHEHDHNERWYDENSAKKSAQLIKGAVEIYYPGLPHGLTATHADLVNRDLLAFCQQGKPAQTSREVGTTASVGA